MAATRTAPASPVTVEAPRVSPLGEHMTASPAAKIGMGIFGVVLVVGVIYIGRQMIGDMAEVHSPTMMPYILLGLALLVALGFEFVNGFHDTANAVATVIYTHTLEPHVAVVWSGMWNFTGVVLSSGAVAFGIVSLLPVELILQVGGKAGFSMVFALLFAAIIWNLGTWWLGLPASSSHTLIGSIIGVGIANQLMAVKSGTSGVDWGQAANIGKSLLLSPLVGFIGAALLLMACKALIPNKALYEAPKGNEPPPFYIRALLVLTCTGVSFFHGSNDGQKGMGLIMLILIGTVPTAYAVNHAVTYQQTADFIAVSTQAANALDHYISPAAVVGDSRDELTDYIRTKDFTPNTMLALRGVINGIGTEMAQYKLLKAVPQDQVRNFRNDMYVVSEALRLMKKSGKPAFSTEDAAIIANYKKHIDNATKFIPTWVKVAVALALGLGTMIGWKRIVVTVGEKIGKDHLTYAQGAAAEITAMATIGAADAFGLPVSTTHVLSSGVAGTMAANHSGLQWGTVRNLLMAWVLTLPASMMLAGFLFWAFRRLSGG
ncbi:MAG TPA: inorganic phosphate transporter [Terriglobales bacterium]|jgi:inorganic phosphate transporter, PiT family|nr:inorganic phosphate transporter [Terriglobales bacterium]